MTATADPASEPPDAASLIQRFRERVLDDAPLQYRLMALYEDAIFAAAIAETAQGMGIPLSADQAVAAIRPDPLGLSRFNGAPPNGAVWPDAAWRPAAVVPAGAEYAIDWLHLGGLKPTDPFFAGTQQQVRTLPFNRLMAYRTALSAFVGGALNGLPVPDGFIFHLSRCGSTLVSQMLGAMHDTVAISEPPALDNLIQLLNARVDVPLDLRANILRAMVGAFGRDASGKQRHYVVKLDSWHVLELPLFRHAFPDTPWIFLYRDPAEILVSQMKVRGMQTVPGQLPGVFGIAGEETMPIDEYTARVLARTCDAAIEHHHLGGGLLINYDALPDAVEAQILSHFGIAPDAAALAAMRAAAGRNAKAPDSRFASDVARKQAAVTPAIRAAVTAHVADRYRRLEALRLAQTTR